MLKYLILSGFILTSPNVHAGRSKKKPLDNQLFVQLSIKQKADKNPQKYNKKKGINYLEFEGNYTLLRKLEGQSASSLLLALEANP